MKVTKTRIETTLYDTNGNKISVVRQRSIEVENPITQTKLTKQEGVKIKIRVNGYQTNLKKAESLRDDLHKANGFKKGQRIFNSMADLIIIIEEGN